MCVYMLTLDGVHRAQLRLAGQPQRYCLGLQRHRNQRRDVMGLKRKKNKNKKRTKERRKKRNEGSKGQF